MLTSKPTVRFGVITPALLRILTVLESLSHIEFAPTEGIVVTSVTDGKHMIDSLHYKGEAVDIRSKTFSSHERKGDFIKILQRALGPNYDIVHEAIGTSNEHIHIEYDPR